MAVYGHLTGVFRRRFTQLLETTDEGLVFEGRRYGWHDIARIDRLNRSFLLNLLVNTLVGPIPSTVNIHLRDGEVIHIRADRFCERGGRPSRFLFQGESDAFRDFISLLEGRIAGAQESGC